MEDTYTYTARSAVDPSRVVTFTFSGRHLFVDAGAPLEQLDRALQPPETASQEGGDTAQDGGPWLKPLAVSVVQHSIRPFDVADVYAYSEDGGLLVSAWMRAGGLRLAPVAFGMAQVDNGDAAQAFVQELARRKAAVAHPGRFRGLLDYWLTWLLAGMGALVAMAAWLRPKRKPVD